MAAEWDDWAARANVLPFGAWKNPNTRKGAKKKVPEKAGKPD